MFNPKLRQVSEMRLTYATPIGFRLMFIGIALFLVVTAAATATVPFYNWPPLLLGTVLMCLAAAAYLERWTFDKETALMERHVGLLFWHSRTKTPLADLKQIALSQPGVPHERQPRLIRAVTRRTAILALTDCNGRIHPLDMVKGGTIEEARELGSRLARFCAIAFEDRVDVAPDDEEPSSADEPPPHPSH